MSEESIVFGLLIFLQFLLILKFLLFIYHFFPWIQNFPSLVLDAGNVVGAPPPPATQ